MNLFADFFKFFKCRLYNKNSRKSIENVCESTIGPQRTSCWRPPGSRGRHPDFYWRPVDFYWRPHILVGDPNIFVGDPHYHDRGLQWKYGVLHQKSRVSNKNIGVSNENMGVSNENMRVSNENTRGLQRIFHGVSNERGSPILLLIDDDIIDSQPDHVLYFCNK